MEEDEKKYAAIKALWETKGTNRIEDIFDHINRTDIFGRLHMGYNKFLSKLQDPGLFTLNELATLATIMDVDDQILIAIARKEAQELRKKKGHAAKKLSTTKKSTKTSTKKP